MSIAVPILAVLFATGLAAYHRWRLPGWAAITACLLLAGWLLGAHKTATLVVVGEADALIPQVSDAGFEAEVRAAEAPDAS